MNSDDNRPANHDFPESGNGGQSPEVLAQMSHGLGQSIWGSSFQGLLWTNWLTAINDNVFRWFVIGFGKQTFPPEQHSAILTMGTIAFVLPYLLFAVPAGWLADRFSKRQVIVACKFAEIVVMSLALLCVHFQWFYPLMAVVFLMGAQSALFSPAKIGTIPELLDEGKISAGNGLFNLATLSATVIGMGVGGWLADFTQPHGTKNFWAIAAVLIGIATVGTAISFLVTRLPAANPTLRFPVNVAGALIRDFRSLASNGRLFRVALGVGFFWSFASIAQINIDAFVDESGAITESERTPMLVSLVLGVGLGSVLAGIASCGRIELGLVPWAACGMVVFAILLSTTPTFFRYEMMPNYQQVLACVGLALLGMSGGFFDVPLSSYLQERSPIKTRGAILAASNFMLFGFVILVSMLFQVLRSPVRDLAAPKVPEVYRIASLDDAGRKQVASALGGLNGQYGLDSIVGTSKSLPERERAVFLSESLFARIKSDIRAAEDPKDVKLETYVDGISPLIENGSTIARSPAPISKRLVSSLYRSATPQPMMTSRQIFLAMGLFTILVVIYTTWRLSRDMVRVACYWFIRTVYRMRVHGVENIPAEGGAVLIANHSSWADAVIVGLASPRLVRMIAWAGNFQSPFMRWFARFAGVILITGGPKSIIKGLKEAHELVAAGELVGVFPEGGISRNGQVKTFKPGILKVLEGLDVPVVPIYTDETWGSIFSYSGGRALWKWPERLRRPISVHVGKPMRAPYELYRMRQAVQELGAGAHKHRAGKFVSPVHMLIKACRKRRFSFKVGDSLGQKMTGGVLLMRCLILRRLLRRHLLATDEKTVGVLIPPSTGSVVVNLALALDGRVSANLNYSVTPDIMDFCIENAGIRHVLTTEKVLEKFNFEFGEKTAFLEPLREKVTWVDKLVCAAQAYIVPKGLLLWMLGAHHIKPDDLITLIFTSGSTGKPKAVMLSHENIWSNVLGVEKVAYLSPKDIFAGILPFFHSFGYTISLWTAMSLDTAGVYHVSPLDARLVGKLVETFKATLLLATPTFLRTYLKRCTAEEFKSLEVVVVGAEKMPSDLANAFEEKFGVRPTEGYGTTELSPLVSVNVPEARRLDSFQIDNKEGTVGRPIPNVAAKITDLDTGATLPPNETGMLWITGPNVMLGYLNQPEKTAELIVDGWYNTGDVGLIDDDGFIKLTGRMSRFSKIGGEMVPHVTIEEELLRLADSDEATLCLAVTAVPDPKKGERILVLHTPLKKSIEELRAGLSAAGLPNLFIPSPDSFKQVESIPVLGTGKLDLKGLKEMALRICGSDETSEKG